MKKLPRKVAEKKAAEAAAKAEAEAANAPAEEHLLLKLLKLLLKHNSILLQKEQLL